MWTGLRVNCPLFVSGFNETLVLSGDFLKGKYEEISNFMEIRPVGAELLSADGRMDRQT